MNPSMIEILGTLFFAFAIVHTFVSGAILKAAHRQSKNSYRYYFLHLLGEIEIVFALWGALLMAFYMGVEGWHPALEYFQSLHFVEPLFVLVIMVLCSTRPVLTVARQGIQWFSQFLRKIFKTPVVHTDIFVILVLGPLCGSFITEPAAMTVTALLLNSMFQKSRPRLIYALLAVLFVNVSIGGALTPFAAPPILMVAQKWQWDFSFVIAHFGWKSAIAVVINSWGLVFFFKKEFYEGVYTLPEVARQLSRSDQQQIPVPVILVHLLFLLGIVLASHQQNIFLGLFLLFLGMVFMTRQHQDNLRFRESFLVALFLGGIIVFGAFQKWWLIPLLQQLTESALFMGSIALTAIVDNAALTYLGTQVTSLTEASRYALVAGAITGGGLTIIANAPNAAGYTILIKKFPDGLNPGRLFLAALAPTLVALICFWLL